MSSIQDDFQVAGEEYATRLDKQHEATRLAALTLEAKRANNAELFARAIEDALNNTTTNTETQE